MNECRGCVWCDKIDKGVVFCMFPKCIKNESKKEKDMMKVKKKNAKAK